MEQFEVKIKCEREVNGHFKKKTESYLLSNCESFTEAETIINAIVFKDIKGPKSVEAISKRKYEYVLHEKTDGDWYKCKTALEIENPDTDKVSVIKNDYLVQAVSVEDASEKLLDFFSEDMVEVDISGITRTSILKVLEDRVSEMDESMLEVVE